MIGVRGTPHVRLVMFVYFTCSFILTDVERHVECLFSKMSVGKLPSPTHIHCTHRVRLQHVAASPQDLMPMIRMRARWPFIQRRRTLTFTGHSVIPEEMLTMKAQGLGGICSSFLPRRSREDFPKVADATPKIRKDTKSGRRVHTESLFGRPKASNIF